MTQFAIRIRAYAAAHLNFDDHLFVTWPDATAVLVSEYTGGENGRAYPVTLHGEIRGDATSLAEAEQRLGGALANVLPIIALAANSAIADPLPVASHGLDLSSAQPFIGYQTPGAHEWFPPGARRVDPEATRSLLAAVGTHPQTELLHRAIESYRRALGHWIPEEHLLAGEFLFVTAETLSRFLIESRAAAKGITPKNLARAAGTDPEVLRARYLRDEIFACDDDALEAMRDASNGFEHGYMAVNDVRGLMEKVLERSMSYVRRALITAAGIEDSVADRLLDRRYDQPRGLVPVARWVSGTITAVDPADVPLLDVGAIELEWAPSVPVATINDEGKVDLAFATNVKASALPPGVQLTIDGHGFRAAHVTLADSSDVEAASAANTRGNAYR